MKKGIQFRKTGPVCHWLRGKRENADDSNLYIVHVTYVGAGREILRSSKIYNTSCSVFKRNLAYFFLLKAAYKLKGANEKQNYLDLYPFVLVFDVKDLPGPYHVYPFDTGGAYAGAFDEAANPFVFLDDLELAPTFQAAVEHIKWAFGTRTNYYDGLIRYDLERSIPQFVAGQQVFIRIAGLMRGDQTIGKSPDSRASAVEIAYNRNIELLPHARLAIMPRQFLEDPNEDDLDMLAIIDKIGLDWELYDWDASKTPADFHKDITARLRQYLTQKDAL